MLKTSFDNDNLTLANICNNKNITTIEYISVWLLNKYGNDRLKAIVKANSSK